MSYFALKIIAFFFMTIDHIGFGYLRYIDEPEIYMVSRCIGRIAFPLFCFLLVNGFHHTSSKPKYALRLFLFALISEPFFDICFFSLFNMEYQNVYVTLFLGYLIMWLIETAERYFESEDFASRMAARLILFPIAIGMIASINETIGGDYGWFGIILIVGMYLVYRGDSIQSKALVSLVICIANIVYVFMGGANIELLSTFSIPFIFLFKDKKVEIKKPIKMFCYIYYPLHIFIIYVIRFFYFF